ncbi:hypothetical protein G7Y89_g12603 [Cudoniella acicularis]|uniref:Uncharacterized protein n=1 Tax=Cudoniella acicularis TaxID=354080 RepID=A0A8H4R8H3_9HELO|nr:hypothetical protein G7Y89_g12603 [Cudoniella acicularis]
MREALHLNSSMTHNALKEAIIASTSTPDQRQISSTGLESLLHELNFFFIEQHYFIQPFVEEPWQPNATRHETLKCLLETFPNPPDLFKLFCEEGGTCGMLVFRRACAETKETKSAVKRLPPDFQRRLVRNVVQTPPTSFIQYMYTQK